MTEQEKIKLKSLNILNNGVVHHKNKSNNYKKHYSTSFLPLSQTYQINNSHINSVKNIHSINLNQFSNSSNINKVKDSQKSNSSTNYYNKNKYSFYPIKEIQMEYLPQDTNQYYSPIKYHNTQIVSHSAHNHKFTSLNLNNTNSNIGKAKKIITNPNHKK
jgi:hypothetical protein